MLDLVVRGDLVLPERVLKDGYLVIQDGTIGAVGVGDAPEAAQTLDVSGSFVFPGAIDGQVHVGSAEGIAVSLVAPVVVSMQRSLVLPH
jgi:allantoinase